MDHLNLLPNNSQNLQPSRDSFEPGPGAWMGHPHHLSASPWTSPPMPLSSWYLTHQANIELHPTPAGLGGHPQTMPSAQRGSLPHPDRSMRGLQTPEYAYGLHAGAPYLGSSLHPMPLLSGSMPMVSSETSASPGAFGNPRSNARNLTLRPPTSIDWAPPGVTQEMDSVSPFRHSFSGGLSNIPTHQISASTAMPFLPLSPVSPHRPGQTSTPSSNRPHRSQTCKAPLARSVTTYPQDVLLNSLCILSFHFLLS
jgi:hypothetical protein